MASPKSSILCSACWTNSYQPVPADDHDAVPDDSGGFMRCEYCWFHNLHMEQQHELEFHKLEVRRLQGVLDGKTQV